MTQANARTAITPTRAANYSLWYQNLIKAADLAENSPVRGCMIIKPWGYAIWEKIQQILDKQLKASGHQNIYLPLLIPLSFLQQEAEHIAGFAKECAVVTHHRLVTDQNGRLTPSDPLEEPYVIRPTSETLVGEAFARWIQSYRDLPVLINQWANVMRWEMRPRIFLRTSEFLWQEGHTAHASAAEALTETEAILALYHKFLRDDLAMAVIPGVKPLHERFPGAISTYTLEAMMQDRKALQAGTSHFLGQNFAKAMNIKYLNATGNEEYVWSTSWGVSTRLIGGLIMTHSDDNGLVLPPNIAPIQVVILPIIHNEELRTTILEYCEKVAQHLKAQHYQQQAITVLIDDKEMPGANKNWHWIKKGVPLRLSIGSKEAASNTVTMQRRDLPLHAKTTQALHEFVSNIAQELAAMQAQLANQASTLQTTHTTYITNKADFYDFFTQENKGFAMAHWNGNIDIANTIQKELKVTIRCMPSIDYYGGPGKCIFTGEPSEQAVLFAQSY